MVSKESMQNGLLRVWPDSHRPLPLSPFLDFQLSRLDYAQQTPDSQHFTPFREHPAEHPNIRKSLSYNELAGMDGSLKNKNSSGFSLSGGIFI